MADVATVAVAQLARQQSAAATPSSVFEMARSDAFAAPTRANRAGIRNAEEERGGSFLHEKPTDPDR